MKIEVNPKVFAFTMLLFSQQIFHRLFNPEKDREWERIQPVFQQLATALSEENKTKALKQLMEYDGVSPLVLHSFNDLWFIMLAISHFRVTVLRRPDQTEPTEEDIDPLSLMYLTLWNVIMKGYKFDKSEYSSRHI